MSKPINLTPQIFNVMTKRKNLTSSEVATMKNTKREVNSAMAFYRAQLNKDPNHIYANASLGVMLMRNDASSEGLSFLNRAVTLATEQRDAATLFNLGNTFVVLKRPTEAIECFRQVAQIEPENIDAHCHLGFALNESEWFKEAEVSYRQALGINPEHLETQIGLGIVLRNLGRLSESAACLMQALRSRQDNALLHYNLGITLQQQMRWDAAEQSFRSALKIEPEFSDALNHLGAVLTNMVRLEEAESCYRGVLQANPDCDLTLYNLAAILLASGQFTEGWKKFEYRREGANPKSHLPKSDLPQWKGQTPKPADNILIYQEQGFGDRIQFTRYLTLVRQRFAGKVSVVCHRQLMSLLSRSFPGCEFLPAPPDDQKHWQWQCALMSLPLAFRTTIDTIPNRVPYLALSVERVAWFGDKIVQLGLPPGVKKIGVVWKTGGTLAHAPLRSIPFNQLTRLFDSANTAWFSLQKEPGTDKEKIRTSGQLIDWSDRFDDFDDTAALIMHLDLVISIDTSVAHLAGALGKPVWLLNRYESEWRWMHHRQDSLWYPTMRIFTQHNSGDWNEVIRRVEIQLAKSWKSTKAGV